MDSKKFIKKKLVLVDSNALMHRAYHAIPPLTDKKGQVVNAVYGFTALLLKIMKEFSPDYIICAFDMAAPTFRHNEFEDYKAHRAKAPEEFYTQIPRIKEIISAFGIPVYEKEGFEADDIIGTIAAEAPKIFSDAPYEIIILTGDLDTLQLVNDNVIIYTFRKGISDTVIYDEKAIRERYNLAPGQMADYKGLRGDPSDNIPGVPGIGEKTAGTLLKEFGSIDGIYKNLEEKKEVVDLRIKPKLAAKLMEFKEQAYFSKYLGTIRLDVPLDLDLEKSRARLVERGKIVRLFQELNFFSLINRLNGNGIDEKKIPLSLPFRKGEIKNDFPPLQRGIEGDLKKAEIKIQAVENMNEVKMIAEKIKKEGKFFFALDYEFKEYEYRLKTLGLALGYEAWEIKAANIKGEILEALKNIFEDAKIVKSGYDFKTSIKVFAALDIKINTLPEGFDIMIGAYLLGPGKRDYSVEKMAFEYLGRENLSAGGVENIASRAALIMELSESLIKDLEKKNLISLAREIELPLAPVLSKMEITGIKIDVERLENLSFKIGEKIDKIKEAIFSLAGETFNINSTRELSRVLFEKLGIPVEGLKRTKTNYSTAAASLDQIKLLHPIVGPIIQYRELAKIKSTYTDALPKLVNPNTGAVHTTFNQALTSTGWLSSSDPNLQNIPIKTEIGNEIRMSFIARHKSWRLASFDYSQIELRIIASMANDEKMINIFLDGGDIHAQTSAEVYEIPAEQVTAKMRSEAKALNFGIIYGMSAHGFSLATGMSMAEAGQFIEKYLAKFSGIDRFRAELIEKAKRLGYAETVFGRRRWLPELRSPNFQVRSAAERMAINMPVQGTAADIIKLAMIAVDKKFGSDPDINLVLQVHDELVFEATSEKIDFYAKEIKKIMENIYMLKTPLKVSAYQGENWGEMSAIGGS
ncbi:DNA polymerase I [Patescibacteria group bacterium]|nr:DNA polymerase I [Patescibacteria group bacterium]